MQRYHTLVLQLQEAVLLLGLRQPGLRKKLGPLQGTEYKLARALYELSLTEGTLLAGSGLSSVDDGGGGGGGEDMRE